MSGKFWRYSIVFIICLFTTCILLEVIVRIVIPQKIEPNYHASLFEIPNALRPNADIEIENHDPIPAYHIVTNNQSIRSATPIPYEKPPQEFRILCLGDSVFFGPGIEFDDLFSSRLEKILNANSQRTKFRVINAAVPSWGPLEYFVYLKNEGYKYSPDMIIVSNFLDDLRQDFSKKMSFQDIQWKITADGSLKINLIGMQVKLLNNAFFNVIWAKISQSVWYNHLSQKSHLLNLIRFRMSAFSSKDSPENSAADKSLEDIMRKSNTRLHPKITWSSDSKPLQINPEYQPALYFANRYKKDVIEAEANVVLYNVLMQEFLNLANKLADKTLILKIPSFFEAVGLSRPKHPAWTFGQTDNVQYVDLFKQFFDFQNSHSPFLFFNFNNHWTPGGHLFFAKLLTHHINNKKPFNQLHQFKTQSISWSDQTRQSITNANSKILDFLKKDHYQLLLNGMRQKNQNLLEDAAKTLTQYIQFQKKQYEAYFHLAMVHFKLKQYEKALALLTKAQKGHALEVPKYRRAYEFIKNYWNGQKKLDQGQFKEALIFFLKANEIEKERELLNNELASLYSKLGNFEKAEFYYKKEIKKRLDWVPSYLNLGSLYSTNGRYSQAIEQYQKALKINPNFFGTYTLMGKAYFKSGKPDIAIKMAQKALQINPKDVFTKDLLKKWSENFPAKEK